MEKKINIAELLKDCPKGMELDCMMSENVFFDCVTDNPIYPIRLYVQSEKDSITLTSFGCTTPSPYAKCVIFPKGKTTWEGFQRPFKDGDILSYQCKGFKNRTIYIYMQHSRMNTTYYVALSGNSYSDFMVNDKEGHALNSYNDSVRLATEEEKAKLFQAIKDNGYKWNEETKTLEKLPKFKVGDKIIHKTYTRQVNAVTEIRDTHYILDDELALPFISQDDYELVPNKFDIANLKPFDKVLVRGNVGQRWTIDFFSFMDNNKGYPFVCVGHYVTQCIPYEGNEHLLGKTDDCDEYYKNWE